MTPDMRRHLVRERGDSNWPLDELRRAINREIQITEAGSAIPQPEVDAYGTVGSFYTGTSSKCYCSILTTTLHTPTTGKQRRIAPFVVKHIAPWTTRSSRMWI